MPFFRLVTFVLLFCTPVAAAQEVAAEPLLAIPAGFTTTTDPAAATALLLKIAQAQFPSQQAKLVAGIELELKLKDRQDGNASEVDFALAYMNAPNEVIKISIDDPDRGTKVIKGFDGRDYWLTEGNKDRQLLSGHEFGRDRESIDEAMDLCSDLMLMLDFRQLEKRNMPRAVLTHQDGRRILVGDLKRFGGSKWHYHLWLGTDNLQPHRLELAREVEVLVEESSDEEGTAEQQPGDGEIAEGLAVATAVEYQRFELAGYKSFEGRFVPRLVEMYGDPFLADEVNYPSRILQIHHFEWMQED